MNTLSWLVTIAFCQVAALTTVPCAAQEAKAPAYADVRTTTIAAKQKSDVASTPQMGEYVTAKGWGQLIISQRAGEATSFNIQSVTGENVCDLSGKVLNGNGVAVDYNGKASCAVRFVESGDAIEVSTSTPEECRHFCGVNGGFEGLYLKVKEGCRSEQIESARFYFKQLYDQKKYKTALSKLSPILEDCSSILEFEEEGNIRNDTAIAQHKLGLNSSCLRMLDPYIVDASKEDDEVVGNWPPSVANRYLAIIKAARTNIHLCGSGMQQKPVAVSDDPIQESKTDFNGGWSYSAPTYAKEMPFTGAWATKTCDRQESESNCGSFNVYLNQSGNHICGTHYGADEKSNQLDEGNSRSVVGEAVGSTAILVVTSGRNNAQYMVRTERVGTMLDWTIVETIQDGDNGEPSFIADGEQLKKDNTGESGEFLDQVIEACKGSAVGVRQPR